MYLTITPTTHRRFILGRQGLWPGRRWSGKEGTAQALHATEAVQIDPVSVVAQSHNIVLWGRVLNYKPPYILELAYEERRFFDYGGALYFYPMEELPYWRTRMAWSRENGRWSTFLKDNPLLLQQVHQELRDRGPLRNRDLDGKKVDAYRSSKDTGVAMYALWISGELMTHGRHGKERIYDFSENIAPAHLLVPKTTEESERYFLRKAIAQKGLIDARSFRGAWQELRHMRTTPKEAQAKIGQMIADGDISPVTIEGRSETYYHLAEDRPMLEELTSGRVPKAWQPLGPTSEEEVVFLSPLEYVSARGRAAKLFDFNYIWEIYKPKEKRVYGPYTMPILYGDRLVGRIDTKHDRPGKTWVINGLWLEDWFEPDQDFAHALTRGVNRFASFLGTMKIDKLNVRINFNSTFPFHKHFQIDVF